MKAFTGPDALGIYLSGGSTNTDPAASLGGARSDTEVRGLGALVTKGTGLVIENVTAANGEGEGTIRKLASGKFAYTPPGATEGSPATLDPGSRAVLRGADLNKAVRVYRPRASAADGETKFTLMRPYNGVFGMEDLSDADRQSGAVHYRAVFFVNHGPNRIVNCRVWQTVVDRVQSDFSFSMETPVAGEIQTVADEDTAPSGVSLSTAGSEADAIRLPDLGPSESVGFWVKREFPVSGAMSRREAIILNIRYAEAKTRVPFRIVPARRVVVQKIVLQAGHILRR